MTPVDTQAEAKLNKQNTKSCKDAEVIIYKTLI